MRGYIKPSLTLHVNQSGSTIYSNSVGSGNDLPCSDVIRSRTMTYYILYMHIIPIYILYIYIYMYIMYIHMYTLKQLSIHAYCQPNDQFQEQTIQKNMCDLPEVGISKTSGSMLSIPTVIRIWQTTAHFGVSCVPTCRWHHFCWFNPYF